MTTIKITDPRLLELSSIFAREGKQLYLVGGCVRDRLLGRGDHDLDLATDALPQEVKRLAQRASPSGLYTIGERFGTIGLIFEDDALPPGKVVLEITTFRSEWYPADSRKPEVRFGTSIEEDLARRDFTINAIAHEVNTGRIVDPFGGIADLRRRVIRAVGEAGERFAEDPLRLMRAVRFAAELGFIIESATRDAIPTCAETLRKVSYERIAEEMDKILLSPRPALGVRLLCDLGLMSHVVPELLELRGLSQGSAIHRHKDIFEHVLRVVENAPADLVLRWAALLHDTGKPHTLVRDATGVHFPMHECLGEAMARNILRRLRYDKRMVEVVSRLVGLHMRVNLYTEEWTDSAVRRFIREAGENLGNLFLLSRADITSYKPAKVEAAVRRAQHLEERCRRLIEEENVPAIKSPLDGNELMALFGRPPGPWIGRVKDYLLERVLEGSLGQDEKEKAEALARDFVEKG